MSGVVGIIKKVFKRLDSPAHFGNLVFVKLDILDKQVWLNYWPYNNYFMLDINHDTYIKTLKSDMKPRDPESWLIALRQLTERIGQEW